MSRARYVYAGPIGFSATKKFEYLLVEAIAFRRTDDARVFFEELAKSSKAVVAGYAICGLSLLGCGQRAALAERFAQDHREVEWMLGCVGQKSTLADFATAMSQVT